MIPNGKSSNQIRTTVLQERDSSSDLVTAIAVSSLSFQKQSIFFSEILPYCALLKVPATVLHEELSPPHTPHLSFLALEFKT